MKTKTIRTRTILPAQAARFLAGSVTARLTAFTGSIAHPGDICPIATIDADSFDGGHKVIPLAAVTLTEVVPAVLDEDLLIVGKVRVDPESQDAQAFAKDCGYNSFSSLAESLTGRLPFVGHVIRWAPYSKN